MDDLAESRRRYWEREAMLEDFRNCVSLAMAQGIDNAIEMVAQTPNPSKADFDFSALSDIIEGFRKRYDLPYNCETMESLVYSVQLSYMEGQLKTFTEKLGKKKGLKLVLTEMFEKKQSLADIRHITNVLSDSYLRQFALKHGFSVPSEIESNESHRKFHDSRDNKIRGLKVLLSLGMKLASLTIRSLVTYLPSWISAGKKQMRSW